MKLPHGAWILVADSGKYLLLENRGDEDLPDLRVRAEKTQDNPPTREQGTDKPGRFDDAGVGRSAVQDTDWHELAKEHFADDLAERLRDWALANRFEHLVLAADPRTLGQLRAKLHPEVAARLHGDLAKDLTNHPIDEIESLLASS